MNKRLFTALSVLLFACNTLHAQIVNTIAGNGNVGYSGDGGPATAAPLYNPTNICIDKDGNVIIADNLNHLIRKVNTSGIITTIAGAQPGGYGGDNGPATSAQLNHPSGLAIDVVGNIYIGDVYNNRIRKIDVNGIITTIAGTGVAGYSGDGGLAVNAEINNPAHLAFDADGNLYFSDVNNVIRKITTANIISTVAGTGAFGYSGDGGPAISAVFNTVGSLAIDKAGNMYVSDILNHSVRMINASGVINTIAGTGTAGYSGDGGPAISAKLNKPGGLTVDTAGNIYIADNMNNVIRQIDASGAINTIAGTGTASFSGDGGPALSATFRYPSAVKLDSLGNIYIADRANARIRKIDAPTAINLVMRPGNDLKLYPNSNNGSFMLTGDFNTKRTSVQIEVLDATGKIIMKNTSPVQNGKLNKQIKLTENTPAGQYLIKVATENGSRSIQFEKK